MIENKNDKVLNEIAYFLTELKESNPNIDIEELVKNIDDKFLFLFYIYKFIISNKENNNGESI